VQCYVTYRLSYRNLVEMMAERGIKVAHSTILRWVARYVPEFEKGWNRLSKTVGTSWRVDETYISIKAKWNYLHRAVDNKNGKTVDFLLRRDWGIAAAQAFFRKALTSTLPRVPRKVTLDRYVPSRRALNVQTNKTSTISSSRTTARSSGAVRRWPDSSHSRMRPSRSQASR
jgi:transposase-like protein